MTPGHGSATQRGRFGRGHSARAYAAQNFEAAAADFYEAYKALAMPEIAFSAAQAYRRLYRIDREQRQRKMARKPLCQRALPGTREPCQNYELLRRHRTLIFLGQVCQITGRRFLPAPAP